MEEIKADRAVEAEESGSGAASEVSPREPGAPVGPAARNSSKAALEEDWTRLRAAVRERLQPEQFETWFRRAALRLHDGERVRIAVQNAFSRDWLQTYYLDVLEDAVRSAFGGRRRVEFEVDEELTVSGRRVPPPAPEADRGRNGSPRSNGGPRRARAGANGSNGANGGRRRNGRGPTPVADLAEDDSPTLVRGSDIGLNPRYTFDNFVVGPCNRFAYAAAQGCAESPGTAYNPLFLHGNVGLGKTHLLQSLCFALLENWPDIRILFLSCESFVNHFINALENGDLQRFRNKYRNVDVLVVDDIHLLANKERTQEEFFHTFNTLYNSGRQIILSSDSPPKDIPTLQERLVSRFKWGLVTEIEPPCYETRMAILKRKSRERGHEIPDDVAALLAERIDTNIRELEGAVTKLLTFAELSGQAVTRELVRESLSELFEVRRGQPTLDDIITVVTRHFGVKLSELQSKKRTNAVAFPRQIAMYLARQVTRHSLEELGGFFGGRDHSTVVYAVDKIKRLSREDPSCRELLDQLLEELGEVRRA